MRGRARALCGATWLLAWAAACGEPDPAAPGGRSEPAAEAEPRASDAPLETRVRYDATTGRIDVRTGELALRELLERIAEASGIGVAFAQPIDAPEPLEVDYRDAPLARVIDELLAGFDKIVVSEGSWPDGSARVERVVVVGRPLPPLPVAAGEPAEAPSEPEAEDAPPAIAAARATLAERRELAGEIPVTPELSGALADAVTRGNDALARTIVGALLQSERANEQLLEGENVVTFAERRRRHQLEADLDAYVELRDAASQLDDPQAQALVEHLHWVDLRLREEERARQRRERQQLLEGLR